MRRLSNTKNNLSRFNAIINGDSNENLEIAKVTNRKGKKKVFEGKCRLLVCCMTVYDESPLWVTRDTCNRDYHTFCEGYSVSEDIAVKQSESYTCLHCSNKLNSVTDILDYVSAKASDLLSKEYELKIECTALSTDLDKLKHDVSNFMGQRETALNDYLSQINVIRQAYHGHVMVGNHCVKVLEHHINICNFIEGSQMKEKLLHLFQVFSELQPLLYANRFLTDQEIDKN